MTIANSHESITTTADAASGNGNHNMESSTFVMKYLQRLKLNPEDFIEQPPSIDNLRTIQEANLKYIPFENLSQHGCTCPATVTNVHDIACKILDEHRGGFCLEVNGLLAELLHQLGYIVCRVPAYVYANHELRDATSHIILIVSCPKNEPSQWMVDVGFGEPAIHPLQYNTFNEILVTPDGMKSKICRSNTDGTDDVILYWWYGPMNDWAPRLKWSYTASMLRNDGPPLSAFGMELTRTLVETSIFAQKMICCRLTREQKYTVAGNKFKITGPPRFISNDNNNNNNDNDVITTGSTGQQQQQQQPSSSSSSSSLASVVPVVIHEIESEDELRTILFENFGIPIHATEGIALTKSIAADPNIWSNQ